MSVAPYYASEIEFANADDCSCHYMKKEAVTTYGNTLQ